MFDPLETTPQAGAVRRTGWLVLILVASLAAVAACTSPTVPDFPTEEKEQQPGEDGDDIGFLIEFRSPPPLLA